MLETIPKTKWPAWVKKIFGKQKGIEIKKTETKIYAYKITSKWDKQKKRSVKKTSYIGVLTKDGISNPRKSFKFYGAYEYGNIAYLNFIFSTKGVFQLLREIFPDEWERLIVFAYNRLINPRPIKSIKLWMEKTYLVKQFTNSFSSKAFRKTLSAVGSDFARQQAFFKKLTEGGGLILYDGSVIFSHSKYITKLERGYNKNGLLLKKANIVLGFSTAKRHPVFFRILPGSIHEVKTIDFLLEFLGKPFTLVFDKAFYSYKLFATLNRLSIDFIIPIPRDDKIIDYKRKMLDYFIFRNRPIKHTSYKTEYGYLYVYEDVMLRADEEREYYLLKSSGNEVKFKEEWAGKIAILSSLAMPPREIYEMWKTREEIEKCFHVLQNVLEADTPYVHTDEMFQGYLFGSFISLIGYYLILNELKAKGINDELSVRDLLDELSKIFVADVNGKEVLCEIPKRVEKLTTKLGISHLFTKSGTS